MTWKERYEIEIPDKELNDIGYKCPNRVYFKGVNRFSASCQYFDSPKCIKCIKKTTKRKDSKWWNKWDRIKHDIKSLWRNQSETIIMCVILFLYTIFFITFAIVLISLGNSNTITDTIATNITNNGSVLI